MKLNSLWPGTMVPIGMWLCTGRDSDQRSRIPMYLEDPRPAPDKPGKEPLAPLPEPLPQPPTPELHAPRGSLV